MKRPIVIAQLYGRDMNIYGDNGNILVLKKRLEWRGYDTKIIHVEAKDRFPNDVDIIVGGGGQDAGQERIKTDLLKKEREIKSAMKDGVAMLMICGMYQLFGHRFVTSNNVAIPGISVFDMVTKAGHNRLIGNVVVATKDFGKLVGFENHSGQTFLAKGQEAIGIVKKGVGNNERTDEEGARRLNVFGTYLHGPVLPKNPVFTDFLLKVAIERKFGSTQLSKIDDKIATKAATTAMKRSR